MNAKQILDTNVIIRFFTGEPPPQAKKAKSLIAAADKGLIELVVLPVIVAETVFTLQSFYKMKPGQIAAYWIQFIQSKGIYTAEKHRLLKALEYYGNHHIGFIDAYLAAVSVEEGIPIASFDRDFDKLKNVVRREPKIGRKSSNEN